MPNASENRRVTRRTWLSVTGQGAAAWVGASLLPRAWATPEPSAKTKPRIAFINTVCYPRSHAHVILENFLEPYLFRGRLITPPVETVAIYCAQFPENDIQRRIAADYKIPLYDTIEAALCCGGRSLAVDGVVLIGEHGDYPENEIGQQMYPRKEFFDATIDVFRRSGRVVPIFNDKHLSYRFDWAKEMYETAREMKIPFLAGSSVPLAQRVPAFTLPSDAVVEEAVSIHSGPMERYGFHGLEVLQAILESRRGKETGVSHVQTLNRERMLAAAKEGRWSLQLASAAMKAETDFNSQPPLEDPFAALDHGFLIDYKDGTRGIVLAIGGGGLRWNFAARLKGDPSPQAFHHYGGPWSNRSLFRALSHAMQLMFVTGKPPYSVERTLLTTGSLDACMHSFSRDQVRLATPQLEFGYTPIDPTAVLENGETWKTITPDYPDPGPAMKRDPEPKP
jgi:hypothetical protein